MAMTERKFLDRLAQYDSLIRRDFQISLDDINDLVKGYAASLAMPDETPEQAQERVIAVKRLLKRTRAVERAVGQWEEE